MPRAKKDSNPPAGLRVAAVQMKFAKTIGGNPEAIERFLAEAARRRRQRREVEHFRVVDLCLSDFPICKKHLVPATRIRTRSLSALIRWTAGPAVLGIGIGGAGLVSSTTAGVTINGCVERLSGSIAVPGDIPLLLQAFQEFQNGGPF